MSTPYHSLHHRVFVLTTFGLDYKNVSFPDPKSRSGLKKSGLSHVLSRILLSPDSCLKPHPLPPQKRSWNACSSCTDKGAKRSHLILPAVVSSQIFAVDTLTDPRAPRIDKVVDGEEIKKKTGLAFPHTSHCLASGGESRAAAATDTLFSDYLLSLLLACIPSYRKAVSLIRSFRTFLTCKKI